MKEPFKVVLSEQVKGKMAENTEMAEALRSMMEVMEAAARGVEEGRYPSFDEAMFQLTGDRPRKLDEDEAAEVMARSEIEDQDNGQGDV